MKEIIVVRGIYFEGNLEEANRKYIRKSLPKETFLAFCKRTMVRLHYNPNTNKFYK